MPNPQEKAPTTRIHASCVAVGSVGVLLLGKSGSGKSDIALRLLSRGATLVADDQVILREENGKLLAGVDNAIRGLLEVRGVGLVRYPIASNTPVRLVVVLDDRSEIEQIPAPRCYEKLGVSIPQIVLHGHDASTPDKILAALHAMQRNNLHTGFLPDKADKNTDSVN